MISAESSQRFRLNGREFLKVHPDGFDSEGQDEHWTIKSDEEQGQIESEVYASGCVIVLSESSSNSFAGVTNKCFTVDSSVEQLEWCQFSFFTKDNSRCKETQLLSESVEECLCVREKEFINLFCKKGSIFTSTLPFKVKKMWPLDMGLCVEREILPSELQDDQKRGKPTMFTLTHPLDDFSPVVYRYPDNKTSLYFSDTDQQVVFTSQDLSLMVTYDIVLGVHSVWKVRKATATDKPDPPSLQDSLPLFHGLPYSYTGHRTLKNFSRVSLSPTVGMASPKMLYASSPTVRTRLSQSPIPFLGRNNASPVAGNFGMHQRSISPHSSIAHESSSSDMMHLYKPVGRLSSQFIYRYSGDESANSMTEDWDVESMPPQVCLEHLWQESGNSVRHGPKGMAERGFLTEDLCGQSYMCLGIVNLGIVRLIEIHIERTTQEISFGSSTDIKAKIAGPLNELNMFIALETSGDISIYSGLVKMCNLDVMSALEIPIIKKDSIHPFSESHAATTSGIVECGSISPMVEDVKPRSIRDFNGSRFTLVLSDETLWRVSVPPLASDGLVKRCLKLLQELFSESVISVLSKYYVSMHSRPLLSTDSHSTEWNNFVNVTLMLMGFPERSRKSVAQMNGNSPAPPEPKKAKKSNSFSGNEDWETLIGKYSSEIYHSDNLFDRLPDERSVKRKVEEIKLNQSASLYDHIFTLFTQWHYLYEDLKLNILSKRHRQQLLANLLCFIARSLGLDCFIDYYIYDIPKLLRKESTSFVICKDQLNYLVKETEKSKQPYHIYEILLRHIHLTEGSPISLSTFQTSRHILEAYQCMKEQVMNGAPCSPDLLISELRISSPVSRETETFASKLLKMLIESGFTKASIGRLPFGIALPLQEILHHYRYNAPSNLQAEAAGLLGRQDLVKQAERKYVHMGTKRISNESQENTDDGTTFDEEIFKFRFSQDLRVDEVKHLLQSSKPVAINVVQKPEVSDHDFVREQESRLILISKRTMALPIGRGMFTLGVSHPVVSETLSVPSLELTGRATQSNKVISMTSQMDLPADLLHWPCFHNGVAAGLKIASGTSQIDSTWIVYNRLKYNELNEELAGNLMALGLTGHLSVLPVHLVHEYLSKGHEFTSTGLLLGMAATKIGTGDAGIYKLLSIHVDTLLPPTALEVNVPHSSHVAALVSVGLLFMGKCDRHLVKMMLLEMSRPPGPEMNKAADRESHSLAAGFALGMIMLGKGTNSLYPSDLNIGEELYHFIFGGQRRDVPVLAKDKSPSFLIKEGDLVNTDITAPSAIIALTLIYLKTNNRTIGNWFTSPDTYPMLDMVKPDQLLLRVLARGLIMWEETVPSHEWIQSHLPEIFKDVPISSEGKPLKIENNELDLETLSICHCCIVAGCCMALGMKFAGSANAETFKILLHYTRYFKKLTSTSFFDKFGKALGEMCLLTSLLSLGLVMAGTGNLHVLRIARLLHKRINTDTSYGSHMAVHMTIGILFLGGGRYTFSTSDLSIAALLCSLYPRFPQKSRDNRYHLQAFRHLYVLACERRLVIPRDIDTENISYVPLEVTLKETSSYPETTIKVLAPCFLPELAQIKKVTVIGARYWPVTIHFGRGKKELLNLISCLFVKKKAGYLPYIDDPKGHRNLMARTFTAQSDKIDIITSFSSDPLVITFSELFCSTKESENQVRDDFFSNILFDCVTGEKLDMLQTYISIEKILRDTELGYFDTNLIWQLRLMFAYYEVLHPKLKAAKLVGKPLLDQNYVLQARLRLERSLSRYCHSGDVSIVDSEDVVNAPIFSLIYQELIADEISRNNGCRDTTISPS